MCSYFEKLHTKNTYVHYKLKFVYIRIRLPITQLPQSDCLIKCLDHGYLIQYTRNVFTNFSIMIMEILSLED